MSAASDERASEPSQFQSDSISSTVRTLSRGVPGSYAFNPAVGFVSTTSCDNAHRNIAPTVCRRFSASRSIPRSAAASRIPECRAGGCRRHTGANRCERPLQAALDFLGSPQTARDPASNIKFDQLFDGEPPSRGGSVLLFLGDQIATGSRRAGQLVGAVARPLQAQIGSAPKRYSSYLRRATNSKG